MAPRLVGLSTEEIERLANLPLTHPFAVANPWLWARLPTLRFEHPGEYLYLNARTLVHGFAKDHAGAVGYHYGPAGPEGNPYITVWLKPR